jgi:hypothetical protein
MQDDEMSLKEKSRAIEQILQVYPNEGSQYHTRWQLTAYDVVNEFGSENVTKEFFAGLLPMAQQTTVDWTTARDTLWEELQYRGIEDSVTPRATRSIRQEERIRLVEENSKFKPFTLRVHAGSATKMSPLLTKKFPQMLSGGLGNESSIIDSEDVIEMTARNERVGYQQSYPQHPPTNTVATTSAVDIIHLFVPHNIDTVVYDVGLVVHPYTMVHPVRPEQLDGCGCLLVPAYAQGRWVLLKFDLRRLTVMRYDFVDDGSPLDEIDALTREVGIAISTGMNVESSIKWVKEKDLIVQQPELCYTKAQTIMLALYTIAKVKLPKILNGFLLTNVLNAVLMKLAHGQGTGAWEVLVSTIRERPDVLVPELGSTPNPLPSPTTVQSIHARFELASKAVKATRKAKKGMDGIMTLAHGLEQTATSAKGTAKLTADKMNNYIECSEHYSRFREEMSKKQPDFDAMAENMEQAHIEMYQDVHRAQQQKAYEAANHAKGAAKNVRTLKELLSTGSFNLTREAENLKQEQAELLSAMRELEASMSGLDRQKEELRRTIGDCEKVMDQDVPWIKPEPID